MRFTRLTIIIFALLLQTKIFGQTIQILNRANVFAINKTEIFSFLENGTDTSQLTFVASLLIKGKSKATEIQDLYYSLKDKAIDFGANCYKLLHYNDSLKFLTVAIYSAADSILRKNDLLHEKNNVYIFCSDKKSPELYTFKINKIKKEVRSGTYYQHVNAEGEEVQINKGGFTGMTVWVKWKEGKSSTYLSLTGLGIGNATYPYGSVGASINTGRLNFIETDLGLLLTRLLTKCN